MSHLFEDYYVNKYTILVLIVHDIQAQYQPHVSAECLG